MDVCWSRKSFRLFIHKEIERRKFCVLFFNHFRHLYQRTSLCICAYFQTVLCRCWCSRILKKFKALLCWLIVALDCFLIETFTFEHFSRHEWKQKRTTMASTAINGPRKPAESSLLPVKPFGWWPRSRHNRRMEKAFEQLTSSNTNGEHQSGRWRLRSKLGNEILFSIGFVRPLLAVLISSSISRFLFSFVFSSKISDGWPFPIRIIFNNTKSFFWKERKITL